MAMKIDSSDVMVLAGAVMMIGGLYLVLPALALVGLGGLLLFLGLLGAMRRR